MICSDLSDQIRSIAADINKTVVLRKSFGLALIQAITSLAQDYGMTGIAKRLEASSSNELPHDYAQHGTVVWYLGDEKRIHFEIHSAIRQQTPINLQSSAAPERYWIYYGQSPEKFFDVIKAHGLDGKIYALHLDNVRVKKDRGLGQMRRVDAE